MLNFSFFFTALLLFYVGYLLRCAWLWSKIKPNQIQLENFPSVSVIIPARNEATNIANCLHAILAQAYPNTQLEIILVNDHSEDDTVQIADEIMRDCSNFILIHLKSATGTAYKKAAVAQGILASSGEIIVTTDADCQMGPFWLQTMASYFEKETGLVSGPVQLDSNTIFGEFQALEFMGLIAVGAASIQSESPTMCNGANLAYRRSAFEKVGGFEGIDHIASGDDELLMHKIAALTQYQIRFAKDKRAIVHTQAQETWALFKQQRIRWVSKSRHYKRSGITIILVLAYLAMLGFPFLLVAGFWDHRLWTLLAAHFGIKIIAEAAILYPAAIFFDKLRILAWLPFEQVAHICYVLWVGIAGNRKSYQWKGRKVK